MAVSYPDVKWDLSLFSTMSNPHKSLRSILHDLGIRDLIVNYKHPELLHPKSNRKMELDLYSPSLKLGLEYQGGQHYHTTHRGTLQSQQIRDQHKKQVSHHHHVIIILSSPLHTKPRHS